MISARTRVGMRGAASAVAVMLAGLALAASGPARAADADEDDVFTTVPADAGPAGCFCALPTSGLYATFRVHGEIFRQQITNPEGIEEALKLWRGASRKRIPSGSLRCVCTGWNCRWDWSLDPKTVRFSEAAIELCDGLPSHVQKSCQTFGGGVYCPWAAELVELRDCRVSPACPPVPRFPPDTEEPEE